MANLKFILSLLSPYKKWLLLGAFLSFIALAANIALLAISGWFLAAMAAAGLAGVTMNYFTPAGIIRFLAMVRAASGYGQRLVNHNVTFLVIKELRVKTFTALAKRRSLAFQSMGEQLTQLQDDVEALDEFYIAVLLPILLALVTTPIVAWFISLYSPTLMLICVSGLLLVGVVSPYILSRRLHGLGEQKQAAATALNETVLESAQGMKELKVYGAQAHFWQRLDSAQQQLNHAQLKEFNLKAGFSGLSLLISQGTLLIALIYMTPLLRQSTLSAPELPMLLLLILGSFEIVLSLPEAVLKNATSMPSVTRLRKLMAASQTSGSNTQQDVELISNGSDAFTAKDLSFGYGQNSEILKALNFSIKQGEKVAIVGASGAGKSTLLSLLSAQITTQQGSLYAFNKPMDKLAPEQLYNHLGVLNQFSHIFNDSVATNLTLANENATTEQQWQALASAGLKTTVEQMPQGLNTLLGEGARQLSAGEARRLHIAQLIVRNPSTVLLDEPTRGLDNKTQQAVFDALMALCVERTVVLVTHEHTLLEKMDKVIWLEQGKIRAMASHDDLKNTYPDYFDLTTTIA